MIVDAAYTCSQHPLPMLVTQSKLQRVCQVKDCDEHVRLSGPLRPDREKEDMSPKDQPLATVSNPSDKESRRKAIDEAAAKKKARTPTPAPTPEPAKKATAAKKGADAELDATVQGKKAADADMLSVSDVARELGLDPKRARAKLRAKGQAATEGRWPKVKRGSKKHQELVDFLTPDDEEKKSGDDGEDDADEE